MQASYKQCGDGKGYATATGTPSEIRLLSQQVFEVAASSRIPWANSPSVLCYRAQAQAEAAEVCRNSAE